MQLPAADRPEFSCAAGCPSPPTRWPVSLSRVPAVTSIAVRLRDASTVSLPQKSDGLGLVGFTSASIDGVDRGGYGVDARRESVLGESVLVASCRAAGTLPDDVELDVPALSLDVTHWMTTAEKRTAEGRVSKRRPLEWGGSQTVAVATHEAYPSRLPVQSHQHRQVPVADMSANPSRPR